LENATVIESDRSQTLMILLTNARGIAGQLRYVVEHYLLLLRDGGSFVVIL
jgi:hypothetical protein